MSGLLRTGRTEPVKRAAGHLRPLQVFKSGCLRDAFRPLWITLCEDIDKEPFHLEKNGGVRCHGVQRFKTDWKTL